MIDKIRKPNIFMNKTQLSEAAMPKALALFIALGFFAGPANGHELRVFLNESCVVADEPIVVPDASESKGLPFAGLIVSSSGQAMMRGLIRGIAWGLARIASRRDYLYTATQELYLYNVNYDNEPQPRLNESLSCMTVVAGSFARYDVDCAAKYEPLVLNDADVMKMSLADVRRGRSSINVLRRANICLDSEPDMLIENRMVLSEDGSAFRLQGAGREINRLLSTDKSDAERGLLLTASLFAPAPDGLGERLSTHWINYGMISPQGRIDEYVDNAESPYTPVPGMYGMVLENYVRESAAHREVYDRASDLERSIVRRSRQASELESQVADTDARHASSLQDEVTSLTVQIASETAELAALRQEYDNLPGGRYRYMPVTLQLTITETRDEKRLLFRLAQVLDAKSRDIAKSFGDSDRRGD
jgi:hypothetical protein